MKKVTRKQEHEVLSEAIEHCLLYKIVKPTAIYECIKVHEEVAHISCKRIHKKVKTDGLLYLHEWIQFEGELQFGLMGFLLGCETQYSIFTKLFTKADKLTGGCKCCLYWQGIITGVAISIFTVGLVSLITYLI